MRALLKAKLFELSKELTFPVGSFIYAVLQKVKNSDYPILECDPLLIPLVHSTDVTTHCLQVL